MEFFDEDVTASLLDIPSINLYSSIYCLEQDFDLISSYGIASSDVRVQNSMITTDSMFHLFDYDCFFLDSFHSEEKIRSSNQKDVLELVRSALNVDIMVDLNLTADEKNEMRYFLEKKLSDKRCSKANPSDVLGDLFCSDVTPRNSLKKRVHSLRFLKSYSKKVY